MPAATERMRPEHLAIARFEPAIAYTRGSAFLDVVFCDGAGIAAIPGIEIAVEMLQERERTPLIWPAAVEALGGEVLSAIESELLPWLESITLARQANAEIVRRFSDAISHESFERARSARFLAAAPYADVLAAMAPYVYAERFNGERVGIDDALGATGAALLAAHGASVECELGDAAVNAFAATWFCRGVYGGVQSREYDITIGVDRAVADAPARIVLNGIGAPAHTVTVPHAVPADIMFSFDPDDAPPAREFAVIASEPQVRGPAAYALTEAAGGSSGKIVLLMRDDYARAPDADTDEAQALAGRLRAEGFAAELLAVSAVTGDTRADFVHAFGTEHGIAEALASFKARGTPCVITPYASPGQGDATRGGAAISRAIFVNSRDEGTLEEQLAFFERGLLRIDARPEASAEAACAAAHVILAQSAAEELRLREIAGGDAPIVRTDGHLGAAPVHLDPIGPAAGTKPFVLVHAPIEWASNVVLLARVAARRGIALVVAGPAVDLDALIAARSIAPATFLHIASPTEGQLEALYRSARVYADVSWRFRGAHRVRRAAASGCALLLSRTGGGRDVDVAGGFVEAAAEASLDSGLASCWERGEPAVRVAPADAFAPTIAAYAAALQAGATA